MAVDVSRFVTPEQDFAGIYKVSETLDTKKQRELAQAERQRQDDEQKRGKTAASMRYFANYLDPKDRYTGTYYDPKMNEILGEALGQAYDLSRKGAGEAEILTAISPLVNKANDYQQKAKAYSENKKQLLTSLAKQKGYNVDRLSGLLDKEIFENTELDKVDPFNLINPLNSVFEKYGAEITNDEAIDDLIKGLPKSKITTDVVTYNSLGGRQRNKATVDMPNLFIQEEENGVTKFVPRYDTATDAGEDILADFTDDKGKPVKAAVRLLEEKTFNDIIASNPAVKHRVESLVNDAIKSGKYTDENGKQITLSSPQARNLGRALMYDMLKERARVESNVLQENKPAQIRNITNVNTGKGTDPIDLREYPDVQGGGKDITSLMQGIDVVSLVTGKNFAATQVIYNPTTKRITVTDPVNNKPQEMNLTTFLQNLRPQNAAQDIKFLQGLRNAITGEAPKPTSATYTIKGKKYTLAELEKMGYTAEQVESYKNK